MVRSTAGRAMPLAAFGRLDLAATSSAIFFVSSASLLGGISLSTRRQSRARLPRMPSAVVQKKSAWSRRTIRLSTRRVSPPVPGSTASSGSSGSDTALEPSSASRI